LTLLPHETLEAPHVAHLRNHKAEKPVTWFATINMASAFPYTHYACPCSDLTSTAPSIITSKRASILPAASEIAEDSTFNPHDPRANYSLYPLDHLLFCNECDEIRCAKCQTEEVINWYCPNCLFEVPSSAVKSDGNR